MNFLGIWCASPLDPRYILKMDSACASLFIRGVVLCFFSTGTSSEKKILNEAIYFFHSNCRRRQRGRGSHTHRFRLD